MLLQSSPRRYVVSFATIAICLGKDYVVRIPGLEATDRKTREKAERAARRERMELGGIG